MNDNNQIKKLINDGLSNHQKQNYSEAEKIYNEVLKLSPNNAIVFYLLGTLMAQNNKNDLAEELLKKSIKINPKNADAQYNLGNVFQKQKNYSDSISSYYNAIKIYPKYIKAYYNLAEIFSEQNEYEKSIIQYKKILEINPKHLQTINNIGIVYVKSKDFINAEKFFKKATSEDPNNAEFFYNYGTVLQEQKKYEEAIKEYKKALSLKPIYPKTLNNMGLSYKKLNKFIEARQSYEEAINQDPNYALAYKNLGNILDLMCEQYGAIEAYNKSIKLNPNNLSTRWALLNTFPIIYADNNSILEFKEKFLKNIISINNFLDTNISLSKEEIFKGVLNSANFYLHYQGDNDIEIQKKYAGLIERLSIMAYPNLHNQTNYNKNNNNIKVGFLSSTCFIDHSVSSVVRNLILKLDKKKFEIYIYHIAEESDEITDKFKKNFKNFFSINNVDDIIKKISQDQLNILIYPDIGMDPKIQLLASLRLANAQCQTLGHPVSSCFKNIDYFISSELMENENSNKDYSEKLFALSGTGQCYEYPKIKTTPEKKFNKKETIFFNLQNLFKLLPNDDDLYLEIIKKIENCKIWFIEGKNTSITSLYRERLKKLFDKNNVNFENNIVFKPRKSQSEFFKLIDNADIVIDSLNWSGNVTTHQAIAMNKPVISMPGKYMRARHTYALLRKIELDETIANSKIEYVKIAEKLAKNWGYRQKIIEKIKRNKKTLFEDLSPVKSLEKFLHQIA